MATAVQKQPQTNVRRTWLEDAHASCDPEMFLLVLDAWEKGASTPLRSADKQREGLYLTDIPINRCAMSAAAFMRRQSIDRPQAYLWRLVNLGQLIEAAPSHGLAEYIKGEEVHLALLRAAAVAKLCSREGGCGFDLEDVARHAAAFIKDEGAANA